MIENKQRLLAAGSVLAILGSGVWLYFVLFRPAGTQSRAEELVGKVMAEETARLLGGAGAVVVITTDLERDALVKSQTQAFLKTLRKAGTISVAAVETLGAADLSRKGTQMGISPSAFLKVLGAHGEAAAVVSFAGLPRLDESQLNKWSRKAPKFLAVSRTRRELFELLNHHVAQVVIVPRFKFPAPVVENPRSLREKFDLYFQVVTDAEELPAGDRPGMAAP